MNCRQQNRRIVFQRALVLACLIVVAAPAQAQQPAAPPGAEKWRPKDGLYGQPGPNFNADCEESGFVVIALNEKRVSGNEWGCDVTGLTDTAPGAIRLVMTCSDYNLATDLKLPEDRDFKEVMYLKKADKGSISVQKTLNGKFKGPPWRAAYCPAKFQRASAEAKKVELAEAAQKAAEEHPWRPPAGVYAIPGPNFDDRCRKSGDAIIELDERAISSGADKCEVTFIRNEINALRIFSSCDATTNTQNPDRSANERKTLGSPKPETILLKKIDEKTVSLQMTRAGEFVDPAGQLSYCGKEAQELYAQQKARK